MSDLDFDELDKAVNQLMTPGTGVSEPAAGDAKESSDISATDKPATTPTPLATRRRGRFMDMVPNAAVKRQPLMTKAPAAVDVQPSRPRPTMQDIQPVNRGVVVAPPASMAADLAADEQEVPKEETVSTDETRNLADQLSAMIREDTGALTTSEPNISLAAEDALEKEDEQLEKTFVEEAPEPEPEEPPVVPDEPANNHASEALFTVLEPEIEEPADEPTPEELLEEPAPESELVPEVAPLVSPFLPDAKVEKRPLGGTSSADGLSFEETATGTDIAAHIDEGYEPEIPMDMTDSLPARPEDLVLAEPVVEPTAAVPDKLVENGAISQQYKTESAPSADVKGSIYDTETYHQPIDNSDKKRSHWVTVLWVLILLVLGAVGGALYFYFVYSK